MLSFTKARLLRTGIVMYCLLQFNVLFAQDEVDTTFNNRMNYVFGRLEKARVPNGLLRDYAFEFTNLNAFNGVSLVDSNYVDYTTVGDIYNTLITSRIYSTATGLAKPAVWDSTWYSQRRNGVITLSGVFYNYARFSDDAISAGKLTIVSDQFVDRYINGVWQNPYITEKVFVLAPATDYYARQNLQVLLPSNLWFTNSGSAVSSMSIDMSDGLGYRALTPGTTVSVNYSDTGRKEWKFRLNLTHGTYLYSHASVRINTDPYNGYDPNNPKTLSIMGITTPVTKAFTATQTYLGKAGQGYITIQYANTDGILRKPLIVAERYDPGHITHPENWWGSTSITDFYKSINISGGSFTLQNLLVNSSTNMAQYDIIYVDWKIGTDYIQRNALLLEDIIDWVNVNKQPVNGVLQPNMIIGQSMGGLITRWALKDMENHNRNHQVRLFISHDSPHQGANIPLGYQYLARHARSLYVRAGIALYAETIQLIRNRVSPHKALNILNQPATR